MTKHYGRNARKIEADDLWGAIRGLRMMSADPAKLDEFERRHAKVDMFASAVICEAVRQVRVIRRLKGGAA